MTLPAPTTSTYGDTSALRARRDAAGTAAENALRELSGMAGQMGTAPARIQEQVFSQRQPGAQSLIDRGAELRKAYYPAAFQTLSTIGTGAGDLSPEAAMATAIQSYNRAGEQYRSNQELRAMYGTDTNSLAARALQGLQMHYGALGDVYRGQMGMEQALAERLLQEQQLAEQQRQFDLQMGLQRAALGGGGDGGFDFSSYRLGADQVQAPIEGGITKNAEGKWVDSTGAEVGFDDQTGKWVRLDLQQEGQGGFNWTDLAGRLPLFKQFEIPIVNIQQLLQKDPDAMRRLSRQYQLIRGFQGGINPAIGAASGAVGQQLGSTGGIPGASITGAYSARATRPY